MAKDKSTICYETLNAMAHAADLKANGDGIDIDGDYCAQQDALVANMRGTAEAIYEAEKGKIALEYEIKRRAIFLEKTKIMLEAAYARFESTDEEKYHGNIKTSFDKEMSKLMVGNEDTIKNSEEFLADVRETHESGILTNLDAINQKVLKNAEDIHANSMEEQVTGHETDRALGAKVNADIINQASIIGTRVDGDIDDFGNNCETQYNEYAAEIKKQATTDGEEKGAKMVEKYNAAIRQAALLTFNAQKNLILQAQMLIEKVKQIVIMTLAGLIGTSVVKVTSSLQNVGKVAAKVNKAVQIANNASAIAQAVISR